MTDRAKIFRNGGSQAVRLPASCRFPDDLREVSVKRVGSKVVIEAVDDWPADFRRALGTFSEPIARPRAGDLADLEDPFGS